MTNRPTILDRWGNPIRRAALTQDIMSPTRVGARTPVTSYPADGLDPLRLGQILKAADHGDPVRFLELAEQIEERDLHYVGVLGTRRRQVSQLDVTVKPATDDAADVDRAKIVEDWIARDELTDELFDMLDAIGKGYSFTEIMWDTSTGQWRPDRLEWIDPRQFRFDRRDLKTPLRLDEIGRELPLEGGKFIFAPFKAKSGLHLRSGLARIVAWAYMFKKYTERDWAIFTQTYGQPLRVGRYPAGSSAEDRGTLFQAVADIAGDCAAIIPAGMEIDFVETKNVGAAHALYKERADWLDQQVSKATLGQTASTDAISGGHAVSKEHREVQGDIERSDAKTLAGILNMQLVRPWMQLDYGGPLPQGYPRIVIARPEQQDLSMLSTAIAPMIDRGMRVSARDMRAKFGVAEPTEGDEILAPMAPKSPNLPPDADPSEVEAKRASIEYPFNRLGSPRSEFSGGSAQNTERPSEGRSAPLSEDRQIADRLGEEAFDAVAGIMDQLEAMIGAAGSLEELLEMLLSAYPDIDTSGLEEIASHAFVVAQAAGAVTGAEVDPDDG
ncbi:MAG: DUF935 family protein [Pseudomonadota bacterium]